MIFSKEFKVAISQLPASEKDKLILRLLRKDARFANRLEFEMTSEDSQDDRRGILENEMRRRFERLYPEIHLTSLAQEARAFTGKLPNILSLRKTNLARFF